METGTTAYNGNNFGIICHSGGKINHRNKHQNRQEGHDQVDDPERIKMDKKIRQIQFRVYQFSVFNSWNLLLNINYQNHYRQQYQHETKSSKVFFNDIFVYNFKHYSLFLF